MNSQRLQFNINAALPPKRSLTLSRLLGFVEGDGTFYISNMVPTFSIKQHSKNVHFFYEIAEFLNKLPYWPEIDLKLINWTIDPLLESIKIALILVI